LPKVSSITPIVPPGGFVELRGSPSRFFILIMVESRCNLVHENGGSNMIDLP
jgi:hypothetical protein